jgi:NAD binding domain of 6-phosphogluconate dehydrogenase
MALSKRLQEVHTQAGSAYLAVPVCGRPKAAAAAKLFIVAAWPSEAIAHCHPLFEAMGRSAAQNIKILVSRIPRSGRAVSSIHPGSSSLSVIQGHCSIMATTEWRMKNAKILMSQWRNRDSSHNQLGHQLAFTKNAEEPTSFTYLGSYRALHTELKFCSRSGCDGAPRTGIKLSWRCNGL